MNQGSGQTTWRNDGGFRAHAIDPEARPELFQGVLMRRFFAFLIDVLVLAVPVALGVVFIALLVSSRSASAGCCSGCSGHSRWPGGFSITVSRSAVPTPRRSACA